MAVMTANWVKKMTFYEIIAAVEAPLKNTRPRELCHILAVNFSDEKYEPCIFCCNLVYRRT